MADIPIRDRKARETRARIAEVALDLFVSQGYTETTMDQIAVAAKVGRRTIFRHFETKEAILFDHLVVRREGALEQLRDRPVSEPPLVSLYVMLRELCDKGYDHRLLGQVRAVLATGPRLNGELSVGLRTFEFNVVEILERRSDDDVSSLEIHALTKMALGWFATAAHHYLTNARPSLAECFDEVVSTCVESGARDLARAARESTPSR